MEDRIQLGIRSLEDRGMEAGVRLHYPLEDWIEELLEEYPRELSSILPESGSARGPGHRDEEMSN